MPPCAHGWLSYLNWKTSATDGPDVGVPATSPPEARGYLLVIVTPAGPHAILVRAGQKMQTVDVGDQRGTAAARTVALVITDLIVDELDPHAPLLAADSPEPPAQVEATAGTASAPAGPVSDAIANVRTRGPLRMAATAGVSKGIGAEESRCFRAEVDIGRPFVGRLIVGGVIGLVFIPRRNQGRPDNLSYAAAMAGVWTGWRIRALEVGLGPFVSPYALGGDVEHSGVLAGAGALARLVTPLSDRLRLVVATRASGYLNRIHVTWPGSGGFATPRLELAFTAGLAWDGTP